VGQCQRSLGALLSQTQLSELTVRRWGSTGELQNAPRIRLQTPRREQSHTEKSQRKAVQKRRLEITAWHGHAGEFLSPAAVVIDLLQPSRALAPRVFSGDVGAATRPKGVYGVEVVRKRVTGRPIELSQIWVSHATHDIQHWNEKMWLGNTGTSTGAHLRDKRVE
jgi:hypothetical protein